MKERPILFNAEMIKAILSGRKTQTRRIASSTTVGLLNLAAKYQHKEYNIRCPMGDVGDQLWVRETFSKLDEFEFFDPAVPELVPEYWYWADGNPTWGNWTRPKPSIHMPRVASRINLLITGVRVERLNDISVGDVMREGCSAADTKSGYRVADVFVQLWESIYGQGSWQANPWVWVIEFQRVETPIKPGAE